MLTFQFIYLTFAELSLRSCIPSPYAHAKYLGILLAKEILKTLMAVIPIYAEGNKDQKLQEL